MERAFSLLCCRRRHPNKLLGSAGSNQYDGFVASLPRKTQKPPPQAWDSEELFKWYPNTFPKTHPPSFHSSASSLVLIPSLCIVIIHFLWWLPSFMIFFCLLSSLPNLDFNLRLLYPLLFWLLYELLHV